MTPFALQNAPIKHEWGDDNSKVGTPKVQCSEITSLTTHCVFSIFWSQPINAVEGYTITFYQDPYTSDPIETWMALPGFPVNISEPDNTEYHWIAPKTTRHLFAKIQAIGTASPAYIIIEVVDK